MPWQVFQLTLGWRAWSLVRCSNCSRVTSTVRSASCRCSSLILKEAWTELPRADAGLDTLAVAPLWGVVIAPVLPLVGMRDGVACCCWSTMSRNSAATCKLQRSAQVCMGLQIICPLPSCRTAPNGSMSAALYRA